MEPTLCNGAHCKCMNLGKQCPNRHYADCAVHNPKATIPMNPLSKVCCEKCRFVKTWITRVSKYECMNLKCECHESFAAKVVPEKKWLNDAMNMAIDQLERSSKVPFHTEKAGWREVVLEESGAVADFQKFRTEVVSEMLDEPREDGIYRTGRLYSKLDDYFRDALLRVRAEVLAEVRAGIPEENDAWEDSEDGTNGFNRYRAAVLETLERVEKGV